MYTVTIKIAGPGARTADGSSFAGHMWYSLNDGNGNGGSFGFSPTKQYEGQPVAPGGVNVHGKDDSYYQQDGVYSRTIEITKEQYDTLMRFGQAPEAEGFSMLYDGLTNSCIDFTWAALGLIGLTPAGFHGDPLPTDNIDDVKKIGDPILPPGSSTSQYGGLTVRKTISVNDPEQFTLDVMVNGVKLFDGPVPLVSLGEIGVRLGSAIGSLVSGDNLFKQLTVSPLIETVGQNLLQSIGVGLAQARGDLADDVLDVFRDFSSDLGGNVSNAWAGVASSLLTAELIRAIKVEGLAGELASTVSNAVLTQIGRNIITLGVNELSGVAVGSLGNGMSLLNGVNRGLVGNAVGGFVGAKLAYKALAGFDSEEEAIGAQVGGAVAGIATLFFAASGPVGWAIAALASFAGNFLGGTLGDLVNSAFPDKASAQLVFNPDTGEFELGSVWKKRDGNIDGVKALANSAGDAMNAVLDAVGGELVDPKAFSGLFLWKESRNLHGPGYFEKGSYFENAGGYGYWYRDASDFSDVVERGVIDMLSRSEIAGGNIELKRALYNSLPALLTEDGRPIDDALQVLSGNLRVASDYSAYVQNRDVINSLIAIQPNSIFAAGWLATLARAAELGLNRRNASDFFGGWQYLLDHADASAAQSELGYARNERLIGLANGLSGTVLRDVVDPASKTDVWGDGYIDLRQETVDLLTNLHREGDLLINAQGFVLPDELKGFRLEDDVLWVDDKKLAHLGANGIDQWYDLALLLSINDKAPALDVTRVAEDLAHGRKRIVDGVIQDIVASVDAEGSLTLASENEALDGAVIQNGKLTREGKAIALVDEDGNFSPLYGENIPVSAVIHGCDDPDTIYSGDLGNDIFAGGGDDKVVGGANADWMYGGDGNDTLQAGSADGNALFGESGNDTLVGGAGSDWLDGGAGDDLLSGGEGDDILRGGSGSDRLEGGVGDDRYLFQRGDGDTTIVDNGAESAKDEPVGDMLSLGAGILPEHLTFEQTGEDLTIRVGGSEDGEAEVLTVVGWTQATGKLESIEFADGTRVPIGQIDSFFNGTGDADTVTTDQVSGEALVLGLGGDDVIDLRSAASPTVPVFGGGILPPGGLNSDDVHGHVVFGGAGNDTVSGGSKDDSLLGDEGDDVIDGFDGDDRIAGGVGKDTLSGGLGADELSGGEGDDALLGSDGDDLLAGGLGNDSLNGGKGNDTFVFSRGAGSDTVIDEPAAAPENARLQALLERADSLLSKSDTAANTDTTTEAPILGAPIVVPGSGASKAALSTMVDELRALATLAPAKTAESIKTSLQQMKKLLDNKMFHPDAEELDIVLRQFRHLVLAVDGRLDVVTLGQGIDIGDLAVAWDGADLLLNLHDRVDSTGTTVPDSLRLAGWQGATPFIERIDFSEGQLDLTRIKQWMGGTDEADVLTGADEADWITGGLGKDEIHAGNGEDIVSGNQGDDALYGDAGGDVISGGQGNDTLEGGDGDDSLKGNDGDDLLDGGAGADTFDGGEGVDTVSYANATSGVRAFLDNGQSLKIEHGLAGTVYEQIAGEGSAEARDKLIADLIAALPDRDKMIQDVVEAVPLMDAAKTEIRAAVEAGKPEDIVALLQGAYDGSSYLLTEAERLALQQAIDSVNEGNLPVVAEFDAFWKSIASALPDRTELAERIEKRVLPLEEMGAKIGELVTAGNREALVTTITAWLKPISLDLPGDIVPREAWNNDSTAIASKPEETPVGAVIGPVADPVMENVDGEAINGAAVDAISDVPTDEVASDAAPANEIESIETKPSETQIGSVIDSGAVVGPAVGPVVGPTSTVDTAGDDASADSVTDPLSILPTGTLLTPTVDPVLGDATDEKLTEILALIPESLPAAREPLPSLTQAQDIAANGDPYVTFNATTLDYGPADVDTLGTFLGSDGGALSAGQRYSPFDNLAMKLTGYIYLDKGTHDFTVTAEDGFELKIGGIALPAQSGKEVSADFEEGYYRFELTYLDATGGEQLSVTSNSLADGNALGESLFYQDPTQIDPRLTEKADASGRTYLEYPDVQDHGDTFLGIENLIGSAHDDTLGGDAGNNRLTGGAGNDTYVFGRNQGTDTIVEDDATEGNTDVVSFLDGVEADQIWFRKVGDDLEASIIGTSDKLIIDNWYRGDQYHVEQFKTADGKTLLDSEVESLVQAMAAFAPPTAGQTTLPDSYQKSLEAIIAAGW